MHILKSFFPCFFILLFSKTAWCQTTLQLVTLEYPPYILQTGDSAQGLTIDIVNEIFTRMNIPITYHFLPWTRSLHLLETKQVDALFTIKKTKEREATMLFPKEPLISQDYVFFVKKKSNVVFDGNYSSLANLRIGVVDKTSYGNKFDTAVANNVFKRLDSAPNYELTFKKLLGDRVDAVICSRLVGISMLNKLGGLDKVQISGPPSETTVSYLVFSRKPENTQLAENFDKIVNQMKVDGTINRILNKTKNN
ncbi:transporter substrate-binding domain-containing protein [uncultured Tolumonas sp.]|uniref:substrate-binding periplasmic protein n=1 Tax=uncultured Tolumonas sp. TaxID=263765 RepID=UPI00292ED84E|nr:transporter substrate-binding domain-containing protein [uncultured Tolumonas sp.]